MATNAANAKVKSCLTTFSLVDLYAFAAAAYPDVTFSQHTSAFDQNAAFFLTAMRGEREAGGEPPLSAKLESAIALKPADAGRCVLCSPRVTDLDDCVERRHPLSAFERQVGGLVPAAVQ